MKLQANPPGVKVLILGSKEYPADFELEGCGGIEMHVQNVTEALLNRKVEFFLVTRKGLRQPRTEHGKFIHIYRVPYVRGRFFRTFTFNLLSFFVSLHLVKKYRIALVHANDFTSGFFGILLKRFLHRPILLSAPSFGSRQPEWPSPLRAILQFFERSSLDAANSVLLFTPNDVRYVCTRYHLSDRKIVLLGNGVDVERFEVAKPLPRSLINDQIQPQSKIIISVGRLTKSKGLDFLIQAFCQLIKEEDVCLLLVGDGPERPDLKNLVARKGLGHRVFLLRARTDVDRLLKASDVFALSSLYEGFPIAVLEAMASKRPVVATRVGAIPTIIKDGTNGILVKPGNSWELYDRLSLLLHDKTLRDSLSERAFQTVKEYYSWSAIAEKIYNAYLSLIESVSLVSPTKPS